MKTIHQRCYIMDKETKKPFEVVRRKVFLFLQTMFFYKRNPTLAINLGGRVDILKSFIKLTVPSAEEKFPS